MTHLPFDMECPNDGCDHRAGVTVDRKRGVYRVECTDCRLIDQRVIPYGEDLVIGASLSS